MQWLHTLPGDSTSDQGEANELHSSCTTSLAASGHCYPGITLSQFFFPFFRLRSDDDNNFYIVECPQDAIQRERQATQDMLSKQLAERDRLAEERTQRLLEERTQMILEEERAPNNAQTKAIYDLFSLIITSAYISVKNAYAYVWFTC